MGKHQKLYVGLITFTAVLITALEILDGTIVSVALNTMRGSLGATIDQMSWTMTAYITAAAMSMPLTGFLSGRFGRRNLIIFAVAGFGIASVLCGFSTNIDEIVIFRAIQGGIGSLLGPLSQGLLVDTFDTKDMGKGMAFYGIGLMTAPIMGPIIGAIVTNSLGWRWDFFINVPVVILVLLAITLLLPKTNSKKKLPIDWSGMFWLVLAMGTLEYVLNRGNRLEWFSSNQIVILSVISIFSLVVFFIHSYSRGRDNIVNLTLLKERNFATSICLMLFFTMCFISINSWVPTLLEQFLNYPILTAGMTMLPRGIASLVSMAITAMIMGRVSKRFLVMLGLVFFSVGTFMLSRFTIHVDQRFFLIANMLQGFASGLFFVPLSTLAFKMIAREDRDMASGLFNFSRTLGSSLGIAIFSNIVTHESQVNWHGFSGNMTATNPNFAKWLHANHFTMHSAQMPATLSSKVNALANQFAYIDTFHVVMLMVLAIIPLCFFLDRRSRF
jgi:DHA2 family multidrug resistance protein